MQGARSPFTFFVSFSYLGRLRQDRLASRSWPKPAIQCGGRKIAHSLTIPEPRHDLAGRAVRTNLAATGALGCAWPNKRRPVGRGGARAGFSVFPLRISFELGCRLVHRPPIKIPAHVFLARPPHYARHASRFHSGCQILSSDDGRPWKADGKNKRAAVSSAAHRGHR